MTTTQDLISRLRLGASISRDRKLNQGYEAVADEAADALEYLQGEVARLKEEEHESQLHLERALRAKDAALARLAELERALVYTAHMGHAMPQHMLPPGVCLFDSDGVQVKLPEGGMVFAGRTPQYLRDRYAAAGASPQPVQPASTDKHWCETCDGGGTIDETLGGEHFSNPKAECPDCDGNGYWIRRSQPVQPSQARELSDAEIVGIAETACAAGRLCWLGFNKDEDGRYTVPALSPSDFQLVREVIAAINAKETK